METYGIKVPFPEVMTQRDYDELYYKQKYNALFDLEKYEKCCDLIDDAVEKLLNGEKEVAIDYCDIYTFHTINYAETARDLLEIRGIDLICVKDDINHRFIMKLEGE